MFPEDNKTGFLAGSWTGIRSSICELVTNPQDTVFEGGGGDPKRSDFGG
jgi:hypothetical protein